MATEPASAQGGLLLAELLEPIGSDKFEPTKVSIATVSPLLLVAPAVYMEDDKLEVNWRR